MGSEARSRRVERTDDKHIQKKAGDNIRSKKGENQESAKYRKEQQDDYNGEEFDNNYGNYYDMGGNYRENRRISRAEYVDYSYSSYPDDSALGKLKRLIRSKPDAMMSVKLHNFSYCVNNEQVEARKDYGGKFSKFGNFLSSVFPNSFSNGQKEIRLYYIVFSMEGQRLFDTRGQCNITFQSPNRREVINWRTNLISRSRMVSLDVSGRENFRIQFSLGSKQETVRSNDGTELIIFDPELRINNDCFKYRMLAFVKPRGLSAGKTLKVMNGFSKLMNTPNDVDKFIETHGNLPNFKILTKEISTGPQDDLLFNIFKPYVRETQKDIVQIDFCRASVAMYQCAIQDKDAINKYLYEDVQIPRGGFRDTAGPIMRSLFNEALDILKDKAKLIAQGGDLSKIRISIMQSLEQLFQAHRKFARNNERYHEFENHFGVFQRSTKQKLVY